MSTKTAKKPSPKKPARMPATKIAKLLEENREAQQVQYERWNTARLEHDDAKTLAAGLKKIEDAEQLKLNELVREMIDISSGNFTPSLPFRDSANGKAEAKGHAGNGQLAIDEGAKQPLSMLLEFKHPKTGKNLITAGKLELVKDAAGATVGDLEKFQKENAFDWVKKISGLGNSADGLTDALIACRKKFPMPDVVLTQSEKDAKNEKAAEPAVDPNVPTAFDVAAKTTDKAPEAAETK